MELCFQRGLQYVARAHDAESGIVDECPSFHDAVAVFKKCVYLKNCLGRKNQRQMMSKSKIFLRNMKRKKQIL